MRLENDCMSNRGTCVGNAPGSRPVAVARTSFLWVTRNFANLFGPNLSQAAHACHKIQMFILKAKHMAPLLHLRTEV